MTTLAALVTTQTTDQMLTQALALAQAAGLPTTAWQPASTPRTLMGIDAQALADETTTIAAIANGGFLSTATGDWLTLLASELYNVTRNPATAMQRTCRLTAAASAGPYTIAVGQLWATTSTGLRFTNITGGTLAAGGTLDLTFQAESPGSSYNVATGTINQLVTTLAGVTIVDPGSPTVNVAGTDQETDAALRVRCTDQWATLSGGAPSAAYDAWAKAADSTVTKVAIPTPPGDGTLQVVIAGASGGSSAGSVTTVQTYINARKPLNDAPTVAAANNRAVVVTGTVYASAAAVSGGVGATAAAAAATALVAALPIGGSAYDATHSGLAAAAVEKLILDVSGVANVTGLQFAIDGGVAGAAADVPFAATDALHTLDLSGLTWTAV